MRCGRSRCKTPTDGVTQLPGSGVTLCRVHRAQVAEILAVRRAVKPKNRGPVPVIIAKDEK